MAETSPFIDPLGEEEAQRRIGILHQLGMGVEEDFSEAAKWYEKGANNDDAAAAYYLGCLYEEGKGVRKSLKTAQRWYEKGALLGDKRAMEKLKKSSLTKLYGSIAPDGKASPPSKRDGE